MSRDLGLLRETPASSLRAVKAITAIRKVQPRSLLDIKQQIDQIVDFGPFKRQHLLWNLYLLGYVKLRVIPWDQMSSFISDRGTISIVTRFSQSSYREVRQEPVNKRPHLSAAHLGQRIFVDLFQSPHEELDTVSMIHMVAQQVQDLRCALNGSSMRITYRLRNGGPRIAHTVSLANTVPDDNLDATFCLSSNFCQLERLVKVWLPRLR